jgi:short subunit dehydrogenase-like uncharacterized protein
VLLKKSKRSTVRTLFRGGENENTVENFEISNKLYFYKSMNMAGARVFDVIVWGSTGFTGRLTCEYISKHYPQLRWAIAGRNAESMKKIKNDLSLPESVKIFVAELSDQSSLCSVFSQTNVLISTAGPYAVIGTPVVEACIASGTHYCDLTGEAPWIREIVDKYFDQA